MQEVKGDFGLQLGGSLSSGFGVFGKHKKNALCMIFASKSRNKQQEIICLETYSLPYVKWICTAGWSIGGAPKTGALWQAGRIGEGGEQEGFQDGETHALLWPIHTDVWQKPSWPQKNYLNWNI